MRASDPVQHRINQRSSNSGNRRQHQVPCPATIVLLLALQKLCADGLALRHAHIKKLSVYSRTLLWAGGLNKAGFENNRLCPTVSRTYKNTLKKISFALHATPKHSGSCTKKMKKILVIAKMDVSFVWHEARSTGCQSFSTMVVRENTHLTEHHLPLGSFHKPLPANTERTSEVYY